MKPKNIVLLGFVNEAVKYLDQHIDEDKHDYKLSKLKNIDLVSLEEELGKSLASSLGTMQNTMTSLLNAGNEAFDEFLEAHSNNESDFVKDINNIFDVDLNADKKSDKEELENLLSFYNLDKKVEEAVENQNEEVEIVDVPNVDPTNDALKDEFLREIAKAASQSKDISSIDELKNETNPEIDSLFSEIVDHENNVAFEETFNINNDDALKESVVDDDIPVNESKEDNIPVSEKTESYVKVQSQNQIVTGNYVNSLINDMNGQLVKDEQAAIEEENRKAIYEKVSASYPYLQQSFVKTVYDMKDEINDEYREGIDVVVLHRIIFKNVDDLRQYAEVVITHGYEINVDEDQLIVDCIKQFTNAKGKIVSNIFAIANQAAKLNGAYDGYRIMLASELAEE